MKTYKHFATISSQLYFCASPIRLDSYNRCQFGCTYCFSRNRSLDTSVPGLRCASPRAFRDRLRRIAEGTIQSAFDEFLAARVPIQFGGLQDPFSGIEQHYRVSLELLQILREYRYPTIISSKSTLVRSEPYLSILRDMNVMVRLSAVGSAEECRAQLDIGCPAMNELMTTVACLTKAGIPVSLRIQPVIPGHEAAALELAEQVAGSGARHISFEYLKIGTEGKLQAVVRISRAIGMDIWKVMSAQGITRVGRDYTLTVAAKCAFVRQAKQLCHRLGVKFGAGDTEFIHLSDGNGCCNGSEHFLQQAVQFRANFVGLLSGRTIGERIHFSDVRRFWQPKCNVHMYLTTDSRGRSTDKRLSSWLSLVAHRWNGGKSPYSPGFFYGVQWTGRYDRSGYKIYEVADTF